MDETERLAREGENFMADARYAEAARAFSLALAREPGSQDLAFNLDRKSVV